MAGYETVRVEKPKTELTEEEFEAELDCMLDSQATVETVEEERALAEGDWAEIQFNGQIKPLAADGDRGRRDGHGASRGADYRRRRADRDWRQEHAAGVQRCSARSKVGQELKFEVVYPADFGDRSWRGRR